MNRYLNLLLVQLTLLFLTSTTWAQDGKMYVVYNPATSEFGKFMEKSYKADKALEGMVDIYNRLFKFPRDIPVILANTEQINCWYDAKRHHIVISYDFIEYLLKTFSKNSKDTGEIANDVAGTLVFVTLHEFAHAFITELEIPITGREEDSADEFACLLLNFGGARTQGYAFSAARWFAIMSADTNSKDLPFWDEHSLNEQRFYDIFAFFYGSDPNRFSYAQRVVPKARLARSESDYQKKKKAWDKLLSPHFRN